MVDLGGRICDYTRAFEIAEEKKYLFQPKTDIQKKMGRIAILSDAAHAMGAKQNGKMCGSIADFTSFSFHSHEQDINDRLTDYSLYNAQEL